MRFKLSIILLLIFGTAAIAQVTDYHRQITKSYRVNSNATVEIYNKYGKIQIIPWNNDSVRFDIDIRIKAKDKQKVEKIKQNVDFEFTTSQYFLIARTKLGENGSDVIKDIMDIAGSYFSSSNSVNINYTVMVPARTSIKIENKFGDVFFEDHEGTVNLSLSYGDLKANRLSGRADIKISSGDADINYLKEGYIICSYANLHVRETNRITAQSQSSVITIEKINTLKLNSRRDKLFINEIGAISGETYFSTVSLGLLKEEASLTSRFGNVTIDDIQKSFSAINLSSELTDISLSFARPMSFHFDLTHHQSVIFGYPTAYAKVSSRVVSADDKLYQTSGFFGSGNSDSKVNIKAPRKCNITISQQ